MSRIHEALLRAEKERAVAKEPPGASAASTPGIEEGNGQVEALSSGIGQSLDQSMVAQASRGVLIEDAIPENGLSPVGWNPDHERLLFFEPQRHIAAVEGFRVLRSKLARQREQKNIRSILVTSACPGEGKTFIAANLAMAFAQQLGKRALLVDADLRRPSLHKCFGVPASPGLTDYLRGDSPASSIVQHGRQAGFYLVTAGAVPPNPAELLNGERMRDFIGQMMSEFDWVVFDSPPATGLADSMILSELADGVLLVVSEGTPIKMTQLLAKEFQQRPVLGTVFNRAAVRETYYYRGYKNAEQGGNK